MIVGRRLAYTGGSLDKIESVPGFKTQMTAQEFKALLQTAGCGLIGTSDELAPADKKLRPLCNTTATAENVPLIVASALSKEIAEGTDGFVMDVKTGSGALTPKITDARRLAQMAVSVGKRLDKKVVALITDMDQPLGNAVGHALEIMEAIETMRGSGPEDLVELCLELSSRMVCLAYPDRTMESAKDQLFKLLNDGTALQKFRRMVEAQGGNGQVIDSFELLPNASADFVISSPRSGYISRISADDIGRACVLLETKHAGTNSKIDPAVGIVLEHKVGDRIQAGDRLCAIYYNEDTHLEEACQMVEDAFHIAANAPEKRPLVYEVIQ
jgi:pyrimidine-nucleoside phosphorylase/thymidine phosphorylase